MANNFDRQACAWRHTLVLPAARFGDHPMALMKAFMQGTLPRSAALPVPGQASVEARKELQSLRDLAAAITSAIKQA